MEMMSLFPDNSKGAIIDPSGLYRYSLWRIWNENRPRVVFIMLNPSTADHRVDDPTIRRCLTFAKSWGYGSLEVVNLFAYRATDPIELTQADDPVGPQNDEHIIKAISKVSLIVAAWGTKGRLKGRDTEVCALLQDRVLSCLGKTKEGYPRHPLYVAAKFKPTAYKESG